AALCDGAAAPIGAARTFAQRCRHFVELLDWRLTRPRTENQVIASIEARHRQRERNALNAQNRIREKIGRRKKRKSKF
ncbi:MAG: hypothetical protein R3F19_09955, partial [Verrucomicrobiales bacterium]